MRTLFIALLVATGALYLVMVFWSLPLITRAADGLRPFDLRLLGYSPDTARAFLAALSDEGRAFYLEVQHRLDMVFPALLAAALISSALLLWRGSRARVVSALALLGACADYLENAAVARLLAGFDPALAAEASRYTLIKSVSTGLVLLAIAVTLACRAWRRARGPARG